MASKRFVLYFQDEDNTICGSDQYRPVDARRRLEDQVEELREDNVNTSRRRIGIIGFRICNGTISKPNYLTDLIKI